MSMMKSKKMKMAAMKSRIASGKINMKIMAYGSVNGNKSYNGGNRINGNNVA